MLLDFPIRSLFNYKGDNLTSAQLQIIVVFLIDLELAIDPPPPRRSFVHYNFLKLHYIRNKMTHVSPLYVGALTCNVNVSHTTQNYRLR